MLPPPAAQQGLAPQPGRAPNPPPAGPYIWTDPQSGPVGTRMAVHGRGFQPGERVQLRWYRLVGNRVSGQGWEGQWLDLAEARAGADGSVHVELSAPDDLGGWHPLEARGDRGSAAQSGFTVTPSAFSLTPQEGPAGTVVTVHLKGVGWTETANIYTLVYDNGYVGYACGFNSQGDVTIELPVSGEPGWHFIDLYPAIYKGRDASGVNNFRIPQLTYRDDHPGEVLPAFRFAFRVTSP